MDLRKDCLPGGGDDDDDYSFPFQLLIQSNLVFIFAKPFFRLCRADKEIWIETKTENKRN